MAIRSAIIPETARVFEPDIFLVDKEPLGLRGEVEATLKFLKEKGKLLVLGLRDVMDEPTRLAEEWERKRALPALENLYDHIWIYGMPEICDPLDGIAVPISPPEDRASPAICAAARRPRASIRRRTRSKSRSIWSRPAAAATARCWSTGCFAPTSSIRRSTCRRRSCSGRSWARASRPASWSVWRG